jgi:hypothetical protein
LSRSENFGLYYIPQQLTTKALDSFVPELIRSEQGTTNFYYTGQDNRITDRDEFSSAVSQKQ